MTVRRHFWIFLFALLLPLAQAADAAHALSHVQSALETGAKSALQGEQGEHCELCALAAQLGGGAAASSPTKVFNPDLRRSAPAWHFASRPFVGLIVPFDSRAPPNSLLP